MMVEKIQHGTSNGGDSSIIIYGELMELYNDPENGKIKNNIKIVNEHIRNLLEKTLIIYTGQPDESISETIGLVESQMAIESTTVERIFDNVNILVKNFKL